MNNSLTMCPSLMIEIMYDPAFNSAISIERLCPDRSTLPSILKILYCGFLIAAIYKMFLTGLGKTVTLN